MKEEIIIEHAEGAICLIGIENEYALYLKGIPIQFVWLREGYSTWRYQIAKNISEADIIQDRQFAEFVKKGQIGRASLAKQFRYLIDKLEKGKYELELTHLDRGLDFIALQDVSQTHYHSDDHGSVVAVIATQSFLDPEVVEEYVKLIQKGVEPIVVVIKAAKSEDAFVLDGHHKLAAYSKVRKLPRALVITKIDSQNISMPTALKLLKLAGSKHDEYKNAFINGISE